MDIIEANAKYLNSRDWHSCKTQSARKRKAQSRVRHIYIRNGRAYQLDLGYKSVANLESLLTWTSLESHRVRIYYCPFCGGKL